MINLFKILLITPLFITSQQAYSTCDLEEVNKQSTVICELSHENNYISMRFFEDGCEFPEGNQVSCLYAVSCVGEEIYRGSVVYRQQDHSESFCLTADEVDGKNVRSLLGGIDGIDAILDCDSYNKSQTNLVSLNIGDEAVSCNLDEKIKKLDSGGSHYSYDD